MRGVLAALTFLTRLPLPRSLEFDAKDIGRSERWFPLVGALVGLIEAGALWLLAPRLPAAVAAILVLAVDALLTGAMHLDGLADTADGFGGGRTREDVLRIMRDHAIGSYGGVALVLVLGLKAAAIAALVGAGRALPAVLLAPVLGRWSAVLLSAALPYSRPSAEGERITAGAPSRFVGPVELIIATLTAAALAAAAGRWRGAAMCGAVGVWAALWGWRCRRRIGGVTGDTLGAGIEIAQCLVLVLFLL
jgi:cobalamin 5'-phosphate synthase/cobalamin synthase